MSNKKMTADAIAGYCLESTIWRALCDVTSHELFNRGNDQLPLLNATDLIISNDFFQINDNVQICAAKDAIWHLGALISFLSSGHHIFGGKGKQYHDEHPNLQLPSLRKEHSKLTPILHACLNADESQRISIQELQQIVEIGYKECLNREKIRIKCPITQHDKIRSPFDAWPEDMNPTSINH